MKHLVRFLIIFSISCIYSNIAFSKDNGIYIDNIKKCRGSIQPFVSIWIDSDTLCIYGPIGVETLDAAKKLAFPGNGVVVVNSSGGEIISSIEIALKIRDSKMTIVVDTKCLSACANYLLLAAAQKVVPSNALIGWHGGAARFIPRDTPANIALKMAEARQKEDHFFIVIGVYLDLIHHAHPQSIPLHPDVPNTLAWTYNSEQLKCFGVSGFVEKWSPRDIKIDNNSDCKIILANE